MSTSYEKPRIIGAPNTLEHRVYIEGAPGKVHSSWHDVPLYADKEKGIFNMIVEVPRWTNAKLEISKEEPFNPIKQDIKKGNLRFVRNCFPYTGYIWNYGAFPQTWEDPNHVDADTKAKGDNDPLDVCEIGEQVGYTGQVKQVKVLGIMALLDEGETDWKVLVIDVKDPLAEKLNDIKDVQEIFPGLIKATHEWFRIYKIPDGKPENEFAFNGDAKDKAFALKIIDGCYKAWKDLVEGHVAAGKLSIKNLTEANSPGRIDPETDADYKAVKPDSRQPPAAIPDSIDKWFYINDAKVSNS